MMNIVEILKYVDKYSLVLFDELGVGIDLSEGVVLVMSILDYVRKIGFLVMVMMYYFEFKVYSYNWEGVMNVSVEFDVDILSLMYKLLMGVLGCLNVFDIFKKLGFSLNIINKVKMMIGIDEKEINEMIELLECNYKCVEI